MNRTPDVELVLRDYFADEGGAAPDYLLAVVEQRIGRQPQRRAWRLHGRPFVNTYAKLAAAAAAILVVGFVGWQLLPGGGIGGEPTPVPTPTATVAPAATPQPLPEGRLTGGLYSLQPLPGNTNLSLVADVPAGWTGYPDVPAVTSPGGENVGVLISFMEVDGLFSDPCQWDLNGTGDTGQPGDVEVGPTVDDLVAALKANSSYASSPATPITIGAFEGQEVELQLPGADVISACDVRDEQPTGDYLVFPDGFYALGPNNRWQLSIVDVSGTRVVILLSYFPGTPQADVEAGRAVVESFEFTP